MPDSFNLESFKQDIKVLAVQDHWKPAQIQFAEDYIDAIAVDGPNALPQELDPTYAALIKQRFMQAHG